MDKTKLCCIKMLQMCNNIAQIAEMCTKSLLLVLSALQLQSLTILHFFLACCFKRRPILIGALSLLPQTAELTPLLTFITLILSNGISTQLFRCAKFLCGCAIRHTLRRELKFCFVNATSWDELVKWNIAVKINREMARNRSTVLAGASDTDIKRLWSLLRRTGISSVNKQTVSNINPKYPINDYVADIATDPDYDRSAVIKANATSPTSRSRFR